MDSFAYNYTVSSVRPRSRTSTPRLRLLLPNSWLLPRLPTSTLATTTTTTTTRARARLLRPRPRRKRRRTTERRLTRLVSKLRILSSSWPRPMYPARRP